MAGRLGSACRQAREHAGIRQLDVATEAGVAESTISKFEAGTRWRRETDEIVNAYAALLGVAPEVLWQDAIDLG